MLLMVNRTVALDRVYTCGTVLAIFAVKAKFHYAVQVADRNMVGGGRPIASWNLAYHALSSSLAVS